MISFYLHISLRLSLPSLSHTLLLLLSAKRVRTSPDYNDYLST